MASVQITAFYTEDGESSIVFVAPVQSNQKLNSDSDAFGFGYIENRDKGVLTRYPFILEEFDEQLALLDWGSDSGKNKTTVDIIDRPLTVGTLITYNETDEQGDHYGPYAYRIASVAFFE